MCISDFAAISFSLNIETNNVVTVIKFHAFILKMEISRPKDMSDSFPRAFRDQDYRAYLLTLSSPLKSSPTIPFPSSEAMNSPVCTLVCPPHILLKGHMFPGPYSWLCVCVWRGVCVRWGQGWCPSKSLDAPSRSARI